MSESDSANQALGGVGVKGSVQASFAELVAKSSAEVRKSMTVPFLRELAWQFYISGVSEGVGMAQAVYRETTD